MEKQKKYKYSLYKELLDERNILSHVFFNCAEKNLLEAIAAKNESKSEEQIEKRKIEIELKIDGCVCDPKGFFEEIRVQYFSQVRKAATKILKERTSDKFNEIVGTIESYRQITDSWAEDINWEVENPILKKDSNESK